MPLHRHTRLSVLLACSVTLAGCDNLTGAGEAAKLVADSKATGSACRHAGRGIEDCYSLNPQASRAAIFSGWKEMNDYMRENKIDELKPELPPPPPMISEPEAIAAAAAAAEAASAAAAAAASASASASASAKSKR